MISIGDASDLNSAAYIGPGADLPDNWQEVAFIEDRKTGVSMGHYIKGQVNYLAVRGTWGTSDILPALRVFLGSDPVERIDFVQKYIENNFGSCPDGKKLAVGGHSLGGLVAAAAAEKYNLPGLAQNSPGWMSRVPKAEKLKQFLQVRTARDVVADWGSNYPRNLMLPDPSLPAWNITSLHNLERQNMLIRQHGLNWFDVDDLSLVPFSEKVKQSPQGQWARLGRAAGLWREAHDYTYVPASKKGYGP